MMAEIEGLFSYYDINGDKSVTSSEIAQIKTILANLPSDLNARKGKEKAYTADDISADEDLCFIVSGSDRKALDRALEKARK